MNIYSYVKSEMPFRQEPLLRLVLRQAAFHPAPYFISDPAKDGQFFLIAALGFGRVIASQMGTAHTAPASSI
jgi:hypothetical protein